MQSVVKQHKCFHLQSYLRIRSHIPTYFICCQIQTYHICCYIQIKRFRNNIKIQHRLYLVLKKAKFSLL